MPDPFLNLPRDERAEILAAAEQELGRSAHILEKDVWVCWVLQQLFSLPNAVPMAFKGGTSLSKVYRAIHRFSEDVDVTFDRIALAPDIDPFEENLSKNQRKRRPQRLDELMDSHLESVLKPWMDERLQSITSGCGDSVIDGFKRQRHLRVAYESALSTPTDYIAAEVKLEPGGKNSIEPWEEHEIKAELAQLEFGVEFPEATVRVLSGQRTFWEKATLIHAECPRSTPRVNPERYARHWYDLAALADHEVGRSAVADRGLLADVVRLKSTLYPLPGIRYEDCIDGSLKLIPSAEHRSSLQADYEAMRSAGMFWEEPPAFDEMLKTLEDLQSRING